MNLDRQAGCSVESLLQAYPDFIQSYEGGCLIWKDGERMPIASQYSGSNAAVMENPGILDQFLWRYPAKKFLFKPPDANADPGRIRSQEMFHKMYGGTLDEVQQRLVSIPWMPKTKNKNILITSVNNVDQKLNAVSHELDELPRNLKKYVSKLAGTFNWRTIANTRRFSPHSYGIAIDINADYANYWLWDVDSGRGMKYANKIPYEVIEIFEKHGFIWGGNWYHYDTMHFEYRPELLIEARR